MDFARKEPKLGPRQLEAVFEADLHSGVRSAYAVCHRTLNCSATITVEVRFVLLSSCVSNLFACAFFIFRLFRHIEPHEHDVLQ